MRESLQALLLMIKEREAAFQKLIKLCLKLKDEAELDDSKIYPNAVEESKVRSKRGRAKDLSNFVITKTDWILHEIRGFLDHFNELFPKSK